MRGVLPPEVPEDPKDRTEACSEEKGAFGPGGLGIEVCLAKLVGLLRDDIGKQGLKLPRILDPFSIQHHGIAHIDQANLEHGEFSSLHCIDVNDFLDTADLSRLCK